MKHGWRRLAEVTALMMLSSLVVRKPTDDVIGFREVYTQQILVYPLGKIGKVTFFV